jgi:hypothetical protein
MISFQLFYKRVEDVAEEVRDAGGVYVMLLDQMWGKVVQYCGTIAWE